jgi:hypothetical protein
MVTILSQNNRHHTQVSYVRSILILPSRLCCLLFTVFVIPAMHATCIAHLFPVYLIIIIISDEEYKLSSTSLHRFSSLLSLHLNILLSTLLSDIISLDYTAQHMFAFTPGTPTFNNGSWGHTTKFRLTERGYKTKHGHKIEYPLCKSLRYID